MWLFDNLFLDQQTPVTINDGVDHSKDVVVPVIHDEVNLSEWATQWDDSKKDDTVSDLFASDKKEEIEAEKILHKTEETDIADQIGKSFSPETDLKPVDTSAPEVSFDIGGDMSFWETDAFALSPSAPLGIPPAIPPETLQSGENVASLSESLIPASKHIPVLQSEEGAVMDTISDILTQDLSSPPLLREKWSLESEVMSDAEHSSALNITDVSNAPPLAPPAVPSSSSLLDLISEDKNPSGATMPDIGKDILGMSSPPLVSAVSSPVEDATPVLHLWELPISDNLPMTPTRTPSVVSPLSLYMQEMPTSALKDKLTGFIEELKMLHSRDQSQKHHKLEQIAMYEERIREIDAEAQERKRVLEMEISDLRRQIDTMDREKNDIHEVLSSFHKDIAAV